MQAKDFHLQGTRLVVAIPAYDGRVPVDLMVSYVETLGLARQHGVDMALSVKMGCALVTRARNELVHEFLHHTDGTHMLCVDSDISWRAEDVMRLLAWSQEHPHDAICGMYPCKEDEPEFNASLKAGPEGRVILDGNGLIESEGVPAGFLLVPRNLLERMVRRHLDLWFESHNGALKGERIAALFDCELRDGKYWGEDIVFCQRLRRTRVGTQMETDDFSRIWIDPAIRLSHHGLKTYAHSYFDYLAARARRKEAA